MKTGDSSNSSDTTISSSSSSSDTSSAIEAFTVTFHTNGGTLPSGYSEVMTVNWGGTITLPTPTYTGYTFKGWFVGEGVEYRQFYSTDPIFSNIDLYAEYTKSLYTLTLNLNGGTLEDGTSGYYTQQYYYGDYYYLPSTVTKEGYIFTGCTLNGSHFEASGYYTYDSDISVTANYRYDNTPSSNAITLKVLADEIDGSYEWMNEMASGFETYWAETYPNESEVDVQVSFSYSYHAIDEFMRDPAEAADFVIATDDQLPYLVSNNYIESLTNVPDIDTEEIVSRNTDISANVCRYNEKLYAFPISASNGYFLYYDSSKIDLEDCTTFDTLLAAIDEASTRDGVTYRFGFPTDSGWYLDGWWRGCGYDVVRDSTDSTGNNSWCEWNSTTNNPTGIEVAGAMLNYTQGQYKDHWVGDNDTNLLALTAPGMTGQVIAWVSGTWNSLYMQSNWGEENAAATVLPGITIGDDVYQMKSVAGHKVGIVNAATGHATYAAYFGDYITRKENQMRRYELCAEAPTNLEAIEETDFSSNYAVGAFSEQIKAASFVQNVGNGYWTPAGSLAHYLYQGSDGDASLITSGTGTADLVINETALQTLLDATVACITGKDQWI